jgi:hypothetical protein
MSFQYIVSKISETFFEQSQLVTPILDPELGNIVQCRHMTTKCIYPDLELGFGPIIEANCGDVIIDIKAFEQYRILENYVSFIEAINYLSIPIKDRIGTNMKISIIFDKDKDELPRYTNNSEIKKYTEDENMYIPLHLPLKKYT